MSDPGLSHRLSQRSRRAGLMIGLSMVVTIAVCAMGFTVIYSALDDLTSDFISQSENDTPTPGSQAAQNPNDNGGDEDQNTSNNSTNTEQEEDTGDTQGGDENAEDAEPTPAPEDDVDTDEQDDGDADDGDGFDPDYQLQGVTVNLRSGPSTSDSIVTALPPSTPLEYLEEDAPTESSQDGDRWMRFTTDDGLEGWIREIDVTEYQP